MNALRFITGKLRERRANAERGRIGQHYAAGVPEISRADWEQGLTDPTGFYIHCCAYFDERIPETFRRHRRYFNQERRGFGEDAFHTMWFLLFREFKPASFLEIGVFRGQTLSLASLLAREFKINCLIQGISPFSAAGDAVSKYPTGLDYLADTLRNFDYFALPAPELLKAYSTAPEAARLIQSRLWNMIYIDGNHDYEIAKQDFELCAQNLASGGLIVLDDSGLTTNFRPPLFATGGHPGPSQLAREIKRPPFTEILQVGHNRVFQKLPTLSRNHAVGREVDAMQIFAQGEE